MKSKLIRPPGLMLKTGVMVFFAMSLAWLPQANAAVSEGAIIENVATVTWDDVAASGNPAYTATAYSQVTVNLVQAAPNISGRPTTTAGQEGDLNTVPAPQTVMSGQNADYLYAVTAGANGVDTYNFDDATNPTGIDTVQNVAGQSVVWELTDAAGTVPGAFTSPANVSLGSAIVAADAANASSLSFPGGSLSGFAVGDIVVINNVDYRIAAGGVSVGVAPDHGTTTAETLGTLTLEANPDGSNSDPTASGAITAGTVVGEQQLFYVRVTATYVSSPATVDHDVYIDNSNGDFDEVQDVTTTFEPLPTVSIAKAVRNITAAGGWNTTNTLTANPGDILEYRLTISNAGSTAEDVVVTDPVPAYTTLQTFANGTGYPDPAVGDPTLGDGTGNGTDDIFAHITDSAGPAVTADLTMQNSDDEGTTVGSGDAAGVDPTDTLTFYVGRDQTPTNTGPTVGGDIADLTGTPADEFVIYYRVRINP